VPTAAISAKDNASEMHPNLRGSHQFAFSMTEHDNCRNQGIALKSSKPLG
jgi:hypothetical protein